MSIRKIVFNFGESGKVILSDASLTDIELLKNNISKSLSNPGVYFFETDNDVLISKSDKIVSVLINKSEKDKECNKKIENMVNKKDINVKDEDEIRIENLLNSIEEEEEIEETKVKNVKKVENTKSNEEDILEISGDD